MESSINVCRFGAKGDGCSDDTRAIQRALDESASMLRTSPDSPDIPYHNGIPGRCGYHYHSTSPEVFFPSGHYIINGPLNPGRIDTIRGEGHVWIEQKDGKSDIFHSEEAIRQTYVNLLFRGGLAHLNLGNNNEDNGFLLIDNCKFYRSEGTAINVRANSNSTILTIQNCQIVGCKEALVSCTDMIFLNNCWLTGGAMEDGAVIRIRHDSVLTMENICCVPVVNGYDQRWIDNYGSVICRNVRFGGEEGGFTPIVNFSRYKPQIDGPMVVLENCWSVCALGNAKRKCAVYCEEIPNSIQMRNCMLTGIPPVLISEKISSENYFMAKPGMLRFHFEQNVGEFSEQIPEMLRNPVLNSIKQTEVLSDEETAIDLEKAISDWIGAKNKQTQAEIGSYCECCGHKQKVHPDDYMEISYEDYKWDIDDLMDGTGELNSVYLAVSPVENQVLVMRRTSGRSHSCPHVRIRDISVDLNLYPYLSWKLASTLSPGEMVLKVVEQKSGRTLLLPNINRGKYDYNAFNLKKLLNANGVVTFDIKLYFTGSSFGGGTRRVDTKMYTKAGDYMVMDFVRMERNDNIE